MGVNFQVGSLFDLEQWVSPDCHLVYFKGAAVLLESKIPVWLDDFIVTPPYSMVTITNLPQLVLHPAAPFSDAARGPYFLLEFLWADLMATSSVSENERQSPVADFGPESAALSHELLPKSDSSQPWSILCLLTSTMESLSWSTVLPGAHSHPVTGVISSLDWTGGEIDELGLRLVRAVAGCWLDQWSALPTDGTGFLGTSMGPLATLTFRCTGRGVVPLLVFGPNGKCKEWVTDWGASSQDIQHGENWRRWSAGWTCWAAHRCWGSGVPKFLNGVIHWGICPWLHESSKYFTHWVYGTCTGTGSSGKKPREKAHWIGFSHLREDLPAQPSWSIGSPVSESSGSAGPLALQSSWSTDPSDSWPSFPISGPAPAQAEPWPG